MKKDDESISPLIDAIAAAAAERIRLLALALARYGDIVPLSSSAQRAPTERPPQLLNAQAPAIAREFVLMTLATAFEARHFRLLQQMAAEKETSAGRISAALETPLLAVEEQVAVLTLAGLVARNHDSGNYQLTEAGRQVVLLVERVSGEVAGKIAEILPEISGEQRRGADS